MSVETVVKLINDGLQDIGCHNRVTGRGGGWVNPSHIILDVDGKQHYLQFWDGQDVEGELKTAKTIFEDVQNILTIPRFIEPQPSDTGTPHRATSVNVRDDDKSQHVHRYDKRKDG